MPISITVFGGLLLPFVCFVFLWRRSWLLPVLMACAVLQSPAFAVIDLPTGALGLSPFLLAGALVALDALLRWYRGRASLPGGAHGTLVRLWGALALLFLASALVLPWLFAGTPVAVPLSKEGAVQPLAWSVNHAAQALNLVLLAAGFAWVLAQRADPRMARRMFISMACAIGVAALVGLQQRLAWNGLVPMGSEFWASNPTYAQNYRSMAGPVPRVSWPFVEPSYASAFFAAAFGGFFAMFLADVHRHKALAGVMIALFALGNTLGATGLLSTAAFLLITVAALPLLAWRQPRWTGGLLYRLGLAGLAAACVALGILLVMRHYGLLDLARDAALNILAGRSQTVLGDIRPQADIQALGLVLQTWGLGLGMGSHRASSYLTTLVANTGVAGLLLFLVAAAVQLRLLARRALEQPDAPSVFFLGGGVAALLAVAIAIPDQNWPVLWMFLLGGFACVVSARPTPRAPGPAPQPDRHRKGGDGAV